jgi:hypothetical protein
MMDAIDREMLGLVAARRFVIGERIIACAQGSHGAASEPLAGGPVSF